MTEPTATPMQPRFQLLWWMWAFVPLALIRGYDFITDGQQWSDLLGGLGLLLVTAGLGFVSPVAHGVRRVSWAQADTVGRVAAVVAVVGVVTLAVGLLGDIFLGW